MAALVATALLASACSSNGAAPDAGPADQAQPARTPGLALLDVQARPGPFQLTVDGVADAPGEPTELEVADGSGRSLARDTVSAEGTALFRDLPPGPVRLFRLQDGVRVAEADVLTVPGAEAPDPDLYRQTVLEPGLNYLPTRDGTTLSALVTLPGPASGGPYPTLIEYSGYAPSRPSGTDPSRFVVPSLGYALVQVNVRGTGCSGGSFDAFEPIQSLDGYDVVETVAAQDWSAKVGMYGISYAGIMQLLVAATGPPSLAAIAPLSVLDQLGSVLRPGGIVNDGFAQQWSEQVGDGAEAYGQGWERDLVDAGDTVCRANQRLRSHNPDLVARVRSAPFDTGLLASRSPLTTAGDITVPVFLAGAWQDEQTGGRWPALIEALDRVPVLRVVMYNGVHADSLAPDLLAAVTEFYDLYLDDPDPGASPLVGLAMSSGLAGVYGEVLPVPFNRFDQDDGDALRAAYAAADPILVRFEQGATAPNLPVASFQASFRSWPPEDVRATSFSLVAAPGGGLALDTGGPDVDASAGFVTDPAEGAVTTAPEPDRVWSNEPGWRWPAPAPGAAVVATSPALDDDLVLVGPASADLWVSADGPDGDIEVTLSEVGPDGSETYIQTGWLRLSQRALDPSATELRPVPSNEERDLAPLEPDSDPVLARVEILPVAHVVRAGSRLRLTVDTPGASQARWRFDVIDEPVAITVHTGPDTPSRLVLPVIPDLEVPTPRPTCGTLRGQPCRP